ncbi:MAG: hypothetical protein ACUVUD_03870 [bacterium]
MVFRIFAREGCVTCAKAQQVLMRFGVEVQVQYVDGPTVTPENLADLAWFDWTDNPPLVVATEGDKVLQRWTGDDIANSSRSFYQTIEQWLGSQRL